VTEDQEIWEEIEVEEIIPSIKRKPLLLPSVPKKREATVEKDEQEEERSIEDHDDNGSTKSSKDKNVRKKGKTGKKSGDVGQQSLLNFFGKR